jgi:hypothetical protein
MGIGTSTKILAEGKINSKHKDLILSCALHPVPLKSPRPGDQKVSTKESLPFLPFLVKYLIRENEEE